MSHTQNRWTMDTPNTDGQIFIGPAGIVTTNMTQAGVYFTNFTSAWELNAATTTATYGCAPPIMLRTGVLATPQLTQQQFGTAALQPGPSSVANTSGPLALPGGFPPLKNNQLATVAGNLPAKGTGKGFQLNWIDVIYQINNNALSAFTIGVGVNQFANNVATNLTTLLADGANGLQTAVQANPYVTRVNITNPSFIVTPDTELFIGGKVVSTVSIPVFYLWGLVLGVSFNFN